MRLWHRSGSHAFWPGFDLVLASIVSWTPLVADYTRFSRTRAGGLLGRRRSATSCPTIPLFALGAVIAMSRLDQRRAGTAHRDRRGRRRERARAARADRGRERRGVRERLLGRGQPAEPAATRAAARCSSPASQRSRRSARCSSTCGTISRSCTCSARSSSRCSRCCSPTGCSRAATTAATTCSTRPSLRLEMIVAWLAGFGLYQWLYPQGPALVDAARRARASARPALGRRVAAELRRSLRARRARSRGREEAHTRGRVIALIGNLSRDVFPGRPPRVGGGPYHGARALQRLRVPARIVTLRAPRTDDARCRRSSGSARRCGSCPGESTATFAFAYDGDVRTMKVEAIGDAWQPGRPARAAVGSAGCTWRRSPGTSSRARRSPHSPATAASRSTRRGSCARRESGRCGSTATSTASCCGTSGC